MATINLLPWREAQREERKKQFLLAVVASALFGVALVSVWMFLEKASIDHQKSRNAYLQTHIDELNKQVKEIRDLEKRRSQMLERMQIIQDLQGKRPMIVRLFDEQVRTLPEGVFFTRLQRRESKISVDGYAESNNRVSSLMRNLDGSAWFDAPNLTAVSAAPDYGEQASRFKMSFIIAEESEAAGATQRKTSGEAR